MFTECCNSENIFKAQIRFSGRPERFTHKVYAYPDSLNFGYSQCTHIEQFLFFQICSYRSLHLEECFSSFSWYKHYIGEMKWFMWFIERVIKEFKSPLNLLACISSCSKQWIIHFPTRCFRATHITVQSTNVFAKQQ